MPTPPPTCVRGGAYADGPTCGSAELLSRAYVMPGRWPFGAMPLVMEFRPESCDLYSHQSICCRATTAEEHHEPEAHVAAAIASFLSGCHRRQPGRRCRTLDLGANNGWFTAYMLQLGAQVVSVEPQPDLARAMQETVTLNCWAERASVVNARACSSTLLVRELASCMAPENASTCSLREGWRLGNADSQLSTTYGSRCSEAHGLPSSIGGVPLTQLLFQAAGSRGGGATGSEVSAPALSTPVLDLIKMDGDGPEGRWLQEVEAHLSARRLEVRTMIVEASYVRPALFQRLQRVHGYTIYRLDVHDARRFITRSGWDAYSPPGTFARLDRYANEYVKTNAALSRYSPHNIARMGAVLQGDRERRMRPFGDNISRLDLEEELFGVRGMKHVFRAKPNLSLQAWTTLLNPVHRPSFETAPTQWVITRLGDLTERTYPPTFRTTAPEYRHAKREGLLEPRPPPPPEPQNKQHRWAGGSG